MAKTTKTTGKSTTSAKASTVGVATATKPAKVTAAKTKATTAADSIPTYEQVSQRAYEIWVAKGYPQGKDMENWQQAEAELMKGSLVTA